MTIRHHPPDDLLLALAAGRLRPAMALALQVHVDGCPACGMHLGELEAVGGVLMDDSVEAELEPGAFERVRALVAEDSGRRAGKEARPAPGSRARSALSMPPGAVWPAALRRCEVSPWRWMAPGMHWAKAALAEDPELPLFLLRIAPGRSLARHTHGRLEFTQVLCGSFNDGRAEFGAGDFDMADADVHHQPEVLPGGECVCLAYVEEGLRYDGWLAGLIGRWIGL